MSTIKEALEEGSLFLSQAEIEEARLDAWYLLSFVTGLTRAEYFLQADRRLSGIEEETYRKLLKRRALHEPLQYLIGTQEFMGLSFLVRSGVLIPRQETELLVEAVLPVAAGSRVLDMCTGSGCILLSIAALSTPDYALGVDISDTALVVARENAERLSVKAEFLQSNLFEAVEGTFDVIVSNPPYIRTEVIPSLMPEVREHEPILALDGKADGLFFYREIIVQARKYLKKGGLLFFEIGHDQAEEVVCLLEQAGYTQIEVKKDYAGLDRIVRACWQQR